LTACLAVASLVAYRGGRTRHGPGGPGAGHPRRMRRP
jgi:hypothetical protein